MVSYEFYYMFGWILRPVDTLAIFVPKTISIVKLMYLQAIIDPLNLCNVILEFFFIQYFYNILKVGCDISQFPLVACGCYLAWRKNN